MYIIFQEFTEIIFSLSVPDERDTLRERERKRDKSSLIKQNRTKTHLFSLTMCEKKEK